MTAIFDKSKGKWKDDKSGKEFNNHVTKELNVGEKWKDHDTGQIMVVQEKYTDENGALIVRSMSE